VEELTTKTGSLKRLAAFASMLRAGLAGSSSAVSMDLLTSGDLEALKRRKGRGGSEAEGASAADNGKRYLICSFAAEFGDRCHYPLPLQRCLSDAAVGRRPAAEALAALRAENAALRCDADASAAQQAAAAPRGRSAHALEARLEAAESELESLGRAHAALQRRAASETAALTAELCARREGERAWRLRCNDARAEVEGLTRRLRATEARVGLRGAAASANFTYARPGSRPSSAGGSRPGSPYAYAYAASSRGASPFGPPQPSQPYARPASAPRGRSPSPRGGGAPLFDPSAYAAQRAERVAAAPAARTSFGSTASRGGSPGPGSRAQSPGAWRSPGHSPRPWRGGGSPGPGAQPRAQSPGAALRDVKDRLGAFTRGAAGEGAAGRPRPRADSPSPGTDDSAAAIADIDARLHALQDFLRAAKTGSAAA